MSTTALVRDTFASFDHDWRPEPYLHEYYTQVQHDEEITLGFLIEAARLIGDVPVLLDFGCGPTVHRLFPFAGTAATIEVADYLPRNLHAVQRWINGDADAWDWSAFAAHTLRIELRRTPMRWEVDDRQAAVRERVTAFHVADARRRRPLATRAPRQLDEGGVLVVGYPVVLCCFCPDSITSDRGEWQRCTANIASLVAPGGWLVLVALRNTVAYRIGEMMFPSAAVSEDDVATVLEATGFDRHATWITTAGDVAGAERGYDSVLLAVSRRP